MANIFQRLRSAFTNRPLGLSPIPIGQFPVYPSANMESFIRAYTDNSSVYTIVSLMARKFAFIPRYLYKVEDETAQSQYKRQIKSRNPNMRAVKLKKLITKAYEDDVVEDTPLSILLNQPNQYQGQDAFYDQIYTYKKLTGNSFVWLNRGDNDFTTGPARYKLEVLDMWVLPTQYVTINVDRNVLFGQITGYTFYDSGTPIYLAPEDVIHWKTANPRYDSYSFTQLYGMSPLEPGLKLLTQDASARDAAVAMFQNGGARGVLGNESMNQLSPEQITQSQDAINTKINNRAMKSAVAMLPGKWNFLDIGQNAVDMQLLEAQDMTFIRLCNLLGCNPQIFMTESTFNNVEQARKDLITNAILPDCAAYKDEENRILLQAFGYTEQTYCIDVDVTDLAELQDDMDLMTKRVMANWTLTPNEMREELGFDPVPDPDMDGRYIPNNLVLLEDAAVPTAQLTIDNTMQDSAVNRDAISNPPEKPAPAGNSKDLQNGQVNALWSKASLNGKDDNSFFD